MWHWRPPNKNYNQSVKIFGAKLHMLYFEKYHAAGHIEIFTLRRLNCCFFVFFLFFLISKVCRSKYFFFLNQILFLSSTINIPINFSNTSFFVYFLIFARGWISSSASMSISWGIFPSHFLGLNFKQTDDNSIDSYFNAACGNIEICYHYTWLLCGGSCFLTTTYSSFSRTERSFCFSAEFSNVFFFKSVWIKKGKSLLRVFFFSKM